MRRAALALLGVLATGPAWGQEPPAEAGLADLPFLASEEPNRVYIDLAPEGSARGLRVMLDTGAAESVFSPRAAREMGVHVKKTKSSLYRRKTRLGPDLLFWVDTSSSDQGTLTGWEYGLLGGGFLEQYVVEIDFPARRVRFLDPKRYAVPETAGADGEAVIPMQNVGKRPAVEVEVNGARVLMLLDTGAPFPLILSGPVAEGAGVESREAPGLGTGTVLGPMAVRLGKAGRVALGPLVLEGVPLLVAPRGAYNLGVPGDSLVGFDLLAEFTVRLDYPRERMWLRHAPGARHTFLGGDWAAYEAGGALLVPQGEAWHVLLLNEGSPAAQRGLRQGDQLSREHSAPEIVEALRAGAELRVTREVDGVPTDVVLPAAGAPAP